MSRSRRSLRVGLLLSWVVFASCSVVRLPEWIESTPVPTEVGRGPTPVVVVATPTPLPQALVRQATAAQELLINLYDRVNPGVVNIDVVAGMGDEASPFGSGSGFLIDTEGHIVTNNHVVEGADQIWVTFSDGSIRSAVVLGADPYSDLAVLRIDDLPPGAVPLVLGDSDQLEVGQEVVAIGNPFGLAGTMTRGIISALGRSLPSEVTSAGGAFSIPEVIQTDAPINPGNSGGPLLDLEGRVIGVNTAIRTLWGGNIGIGFAIPVNMVKRIVPYLITEGTFHYPYLGVIAETDFTLAQLAVELGLPVDQGVLVSSVVAGGPADQAGIRGGNEEAEVWGRRVTVGGDIIVAIDGYTVRDFSELVAYLIRETHVGQEVVLTVVRDGERLQIPVVLGERP